MKIQETGKFQNLKNYQKFKEYLFDNFLSTYPYLRKDTDHFSISLHTENSQKIGTVNINQNKVSVSVNDKYKSKEEIIQDTKDALEEVKNALKETENRCIEYFTEFKEQYKSHSDKIQNMSDVFSSYDIDELSRLMNNIKSIKTQYYAFEREKYLLEKELTDLEDSE